MFNKASSDLELTVKVGKDKKEVKIGKDEYYVLDRGNPVLKHDTLIKLAESNGVFIDKTVLEFGSFHNANNFCFIHRAYATLEDGNVIDEVGEANPKNLDSKLGGNYPAIMSNKRAQDRLIIRLLGLQGQVYSDTEFGSTEIKEETSEDKEEVAERLTLEKAENLIVDFGKTYSKKPITLKELKERDENSFKWLTETYKVTPGSSDKMKMLHRGAMMLKGA